MGRGDRRALRNAATMTVVSEIQHYAWKTVVGSSQVLVICIQIHVTVRSHAPLQHSNSLAPSRCGSIAPPPPHPTLTTFGVKLQWNALRATKNDAQYKKIGWPVFKSLPSYYCICASCLKFTGWIVRGSNPGVGTRDFLPQKRPHRSCDLPGPLFNGYRGSFPGIKRPGNESNH